MEVSSQTKRYNRFVVKATFNFSQQAVNHTLKTRTFIHLTNVNTYRYVDVLQALLDGYNATYHRSIKMQPQHVRYVHQSIIPQCLYGTSEKRTSSSL